MSWISPMYSKKFKIENLIRPTKVLSVMRAHTKYLTLLSFYLASYCIFTAFQLRIHNYNIAKEKQQILDPWLVHSTVHVTVLSACALLSASAILEALDLPHFEGLQQPLKSSPPDSF